MEKVNSMSIIIPIIGPTIEKIREQIAQAHMADLLEWRIDLFAPYKLEELQELRKTLAQPVVFTLRKKEQGGSFSGSESERLDEIKRLLTLSPEYFDVEFDTILDTGKTKRITSYHNFESTPDDLESILKLMRKVPSYLYKMATMAHSTNDSLRMIKLCQENSDLFGLCMGEKGMITRVLAKPFTFVCLSQQQESAPNQLTIDEYQIYRKKGRKLFGLIGTKVSQSLADRTHNKLMQENDLDAVYLKMIVEKEELTQFFQLAKEVGFYGLSVTIALKEAVLSFLDEIDADAKKIGAVNTIKFQKDKLFGYNTDAKGALDAIEKRTLVKGKKVVIVGAGGAARALIFEAKKRGAAAMIINRTKKKAQDLAAEFDVDVSEFEKNYDILINTTPEPLPIDPTMICPGSFIMDITTKPKKTTLLQLAEEKGCGLIFGYEMFINQALQQFAIWFENKQLTVESFKQELLKNL